MTENKKSSISGKNRAFHKSTESSSPRNSSTILYEAIDAFKQVLIDNGAVIDTIKTDVGIQRVRHETDKGNSRSFWYNFHTDGDIPAGAFGNWRSGLSDTFFYKKDNKPLTDAERKALTKIYADAKKKREAETQKKYATARRIAHATFSKAQPAKPDHPYIVKKQIQGVEKYLRMDAKGNLLVPIYNNKRLASLQYINQKGGKFFVKGSELKGSFMMLGTLTKPFNEIFICEGISTGWTVHTLADQAPTFCAMNAGNLKNVALAVRKHYPAIKIIVAGDNDQRTDGSINIGVEKAKAAAHAVGGYYSIPQFPDPSQKGDWNDLYLSCARKGANDE